MCKCALIFNKNLLLNYHSLIICKSNDDNLSGAVSTFNGHDGPKLFNFTFIFIN